MTRAARVLLAGSGWALVVVPLILRWPWAVVGPALALSAAIMAVAVWYPAATRVVPAPEPAAPEGPDPAETTFQIGNQALPHLRQGLNRETAGHLADIIQHTTEVDAVAITDTQVVLGWAGKPCPPHQPGSQLSSTTRSTMADRVTRVLDTQELMGSYDECDLGTVVITPLVSHGQSVGALKLYIASHKLLPSRILQHAEGIAQMLSLLMEVVEADRQRTLAADARLEALQAQIRPHFLFNVLNTIVAFSRTDPDRARDLLVELAAFFRRSLQHRGPTIALRDEIEYVNTYLTLERARFGERLLYRVRVDPRALDVQVPVLTLQPLVENAVVHGLSRRDQPGMVSVTARLVSNRLAIYVSDNGVGIPKAQQYEIFEMGRGSGMGLGLSNVAERMMGLYGPHYHLRLRSREGVGTTVRLSIPVTAEKGARSNATA
jgi:two-component system LytT family sensor kinase